MGADTEVEETLREIRRHLRAETEARGANGEDRSRRALAQIEADLTVTERAWGRLPPIQSERRGPVARFELWLKRGIKRAAHWFTWEQINFNASVNHALSAAHRLLSAHDGEIEELRARVERLAECERELQSLREEVERLGGAARAGEGRAGNGRPPVG